jgi:hypothetical protein
MCAERLRWLDDGRVLYELRRPFKDGTAYFEFPDAFSFIARLVPLIPTPYAQCPSFSWVWE